MHLFEKVYKDQYLQYHTRPVVKNSLDPRVFEYSDYGKDPEMNDLVRMQIVRDVQSINEQENEFNKTRVFEYVVVGPILKPGSSEKCPIQIIVQLNTNNLTDILKERILNRIKTLNKRIAPGTQHPLQYLPTIRPINTEQYVAIFHPFTNKWLKKPRFLGK